MVDIPAEEPEDDSEEIDYAGPDYGQQGTNRQVMPSDVLQEEEAVDYQQRGTGYVPRGAEQPDGAGELASVDDEDDASGR